MSKDLSVVQAHEANSSGRIFAEAEAIPKRLERGITKRNKRLPKFSTLINNYLLLVKSYVEGHSNVLSLCSHTHTNARLHPYTSRESTVTSTINGTSGCFFKVRLLFNCHNHKS